MVVYKEGNQDMRVSNVDFFFKCNDCGCEWGAKRKEVNITPPCLPFAAYMKCPNCRKTVYDRN